MIHFRIGLPRIATTFVGGNVKLKVIFFICFFILFNLEYFCLKDGSNQYDLTF